MPEKYTFAILGGDMRQIVIAKMLLALGHSVSVFGLNGFPASAVKTEYCLSVKKAIEGCDAVILPLPVSRDSKSLNQPIGDKTEPVSLEDIVNEAAKNNNKLIIGGIIPDSMKEVAKKHGVTVEDYYAYDDLQQKNALPSAEGALMLAMENSDTVIDGMEVLVTGYGKTGILIAEKLRALGAHVSVAARRDEVLCEIAMNGFDTVHINDEKEMTTTVDRCEIIINTVPHIVFTKKILHDCKNVPLYIEIASAPGGIDIPPARSLGIRLIIAPSLPGKYAPVSAGKYIIETISDILRKGGINI